MRLAVFIFALGAAVSAFGAELAKEDIVDRRLSLADARKVEVYRLSKGGVALAQLGANGGPTVAPVFRWKIEAGCLVISDADRVVDSLKLIEKKDSRWSFRRQNGEIAVFEVARAE